MIRSIFVCLFLTALALPVKATENAGIPATFLQGMGNPHYHYLESETIGRGYHIFVKLPEDYDPAGSQTYPSVYLLDGGNLFPMLSAYSGYLNFGEETPDIILVGISYGGSTFEEGNYRSTDYTAPSDDRDYWGGAEEFQSFLADDLIPFIERSYKAKHSRRVIFGQSLGGQFVLYTLLTRPDLFWGHIASNPALHRNLPFFLRQYDEPGTGSERPRVFVADGTLNDARFRQPSLQWIEHWNSLDNRGWDFKAVDLEGHSHMSAPPAAFRQGMSWVFSAE